MTSSLSQSRVLNPDLEDRSLLRYQSIHVSEHIWDGREHPVLKVRRSHFIPADMEGVPVEILPHLILAGFVGVAQLTCFPIDRHLITALTGFRIDGKVMIAAVGGDKTQIVEDLLGIRPPADAF
ncbi:uncharacterized protein LOC113871491 [Abrus precatorius]|uniref:Uncharacterized protein LOC113871491 n=1 Tax=Abrus precatorius TaxID=3816 RepID=A0A8B8MBC2_ABRPR|nr:uncharacterized protein LOC113871491 [Abrus precatorius]